MMVNDLEKTSYTEGEPDELAAVIGGSGITVPLNIHVWLSVIQVFFV
jgi:hypothetical protein